MNPAYNDYSLKGRIWNGLNLYHIVDNIYFRVELGLLLKYKDMLWAGSTSSTRSISNNSLRGPTNTTLIVTKLTTLTTRTYGTALSQTKRATLIVTQLLYYYKSSVEKQFKA